MPGPRRQRSRGTIVSHSVDHPKFVRLEYASLRFLRLAVCGSNLCIENRNDGLAAGRMEGAGPRLEALRFRPA